MKTGFLSVLVLAVSAPLWGQEPQTAVVAPTPPATAVVTPTMPAPTQAIYTPRLPAPEELTNAAAANGNAIEQIVQTPTEITVTYRTQSGQTSTLAYRLLPGAAPVATPAGSAPPPAPPVVVTAPPPPAVYVEQAPRVVYYYREPYYGYPAFYPWRWYPTFSARFGVGHRFHSRGHRR